MWKWLGFNFFRKSNDQNTSNEKNEQQQFYKTESVAQQLHVVPHVTQLHWLSEPAKFYSPSVHLLYPRLDYQGKNGTYVQSYFNITNGEDRRKQQEIPSRSSEKRGSLRAIVPYVKPTPQYTNKRKLAASYFPRFIMTVLEALRHLKEESPICGGYSLNTITRHVAENFIVDGDVDSQVRTALRLAHVSGLIIYLKNFRAYQLATPEIETMYVGKRRYLRFLRRRRDIADIDTQKLMTEIPECHTEEGNDGQTLAPTG